MYMAVIAVLSVILTAQTIFSFDSFRYTKYIEPKTEEVSPEEAYLYMKEHPGEYMFLDVRTIGEYNNLHAINSISLPIANLFDDWKILPRSKDKKIYLICTTGRLASVAYGYLQLHGFTNIIHVEGGIQNWINEGLPVNVGKNKVNPNYSLDIPINLVNATSSGN